jgi:tRNA modification GTPase
MLQSTIIAPASGTGPAGVAIIRISGPAARDVIIGLSGDLPLPRKAALRTLIGPDGEKIDQALVLWFPAPASFTGEDVGEFHVHGGKAVIADVIEACLSIPGVALAMPGEFTRRAFENGKMDLSSAEGLADLIEAETKAQRRQALRQLEGGLALEVTAWREMIIAALGDAEGDIDFPDENLPAGLSAQVRGRILELRSTLQHYLAQSEHAIRVRDGFRVAIIGAPNAGKSSLLNALAKREAAIVSSIAGTTRDVVEVRLVLEGLVIWIADTAGLRDSLDELESMGISRGIDQAEAADLRFGVIASEAERGPLGAFMKADDIWILGKADARDWGPSRPNEIMISSHTGLGIALLETAISQKAAADMANFETAPLTRLRHKIAVQDTIDALSRALDATCDTPELIAEDLRLAARSLGTIIGRVDMEDVLNRIFSQFCIGK